MAQLQVGGPSKFAVHCSGGSLAVPDQNTGVVGQLRGRRERKAEQEICNPTIENLCLPMSVGSDFAMASSAVLAHTMHVPLALLMVACCHPESIASVITKSGHRSCKVLN